MNKVSQGILVAVVGLGSACVEDSCIAEGTMILVPSGRVLIESLRVGDRVYALDVSTNGLVETAITAIRSAKRECVAAVLGGGDSLRCTPNHPLYDPEEGVYAPASEWIEGRRGRLLRVTSEGVPEEIGVEDKVVYAGVFEVFDLSVESEHHNYVAGGVLVHNKTSPDDTGNPYSSLSGQSGTGGDTDTTGGQSSTVGDAGTEPSGSSSGGTSSSSSGTVGTSSGSGSGSGGSGTGSGSSGTTGSSGTAG